MLQRSFDNQLFYGYKCLIVQVRSNLIRTSKTKLHETKMSPGINGWAWHVLANILGKDIKSYEARLSQNNLRKVFVEAFTKIYVQYHILLSQNYLKNETFVGKSLGGK